MDKDEALKSKVMYKSQKKAHTGMGEDGKVEAGK